MSKLQKALKILRESHDGDASRDNAARRARHPSGDAPAADRGAKPQPGIGIEPGHFMKLDHARLQAAGLERSDDDHAELAQQFRRIKRPILHQSFSAGAALEKNANVVMMASALPGAGKTFCSFSLAESISLERDFGAILVDADVLKSRLSRSLGIEGRVGLIDYLLDPAVRLADILIRTDFFDIVVVPAGRQHPEATELLASRRMQNLVESLSTAFSDRIVIFDTPPLLATNEAHVLAEHMGQIVVVIEAGESEQNTVTHALESLNHEKPINAILNKSKMASSRGYYGSGYGFYGQDERVHSNDAEKQE